MIPPDKHKPCLSSSSHSVCGENESVSTHTFTVSHGICKYSRDLIRSCVCALCSILLHAKRTPDDVLTTFLGLERGSCVAVYAGSESSRILLKIS